MSRILNKIYHRLLKNLRRRRHWKLPKIQFSNFLINQNKLIFSDNFLVKLIYFGLNQMCKYNLQFGTLIYLTYFTSSWFIVGTRNKFTIIDLNWTLLYFRRTLIIFCGCILMKRHICVVNDHKFMFDYLNNLAVSTGESFFVGHWLGGSLTNYKRIWLISKKLSKINPIFKSLKQFKIFKSLVGIKNIPSLPGASIINSAKRSRGASLESRVLTIPTFSLLDSDYVAVNSFYPLPSNDDGVGAFYFFDNIIFRIVLLMKIFLLLKRKKDKLFFKKKLNNHFNLFVKRQKFESSKIYFEALMFFRNCQNKEEIIYFDNYFWTKQWYSYKLKCYFFGKLLGLFPKYRHWLLHKIKFFQKKRRLFKDKKFQYNFIT